MITPLRFNEHDYDENYNRYDPEETAKIRVLINGGNLNISIPEK